MNTRANQAQKNENYTIKDGALVKISPFWANSDYKSCEILANCIFQFLRECTGNKYRENFLNSRIIEQTYSFRGEYSLFYTDNSRIEILDCNECYYVCHGCQMVLPERLIQIDHVREKNTAANPSGALKGYDAITQIFYPLGLTMAGTPGDLFSTKIRRIYL